MSHTEMNIFSTRDEESEKVKQKKWNSMSPYAMAFQMFKDKKTLADVAIELDIKTDMVLRFHSDYLRLVRMDGLVKIYNDLGMTFPYSSICIDE